jgi:hypothetical protein
MDTEIYLLDSAEVDSGTGRVVLRFRGFAPIHVQATLTVMRHLKMAVTECVARLGRSEEPPDDPASIL